MNGPSSSTSTSTATSTGPADSIFAQLDATVAAGNRAQAVEQLVEHLQQQRQYHELFEALKMQMRLRLGLTAAQADRQEKFDEATEMELERGLIDACRIVGELFFKQGKIREGWMYMRPVGDRELAAAALSTVEPNDDNLD